MKDFNHFENLYLDKIESKDPYTRNQSNRVSSFSVLIGEKLGMNKEDLELLRIGSLFHDIGKIGISDNILFKNSELTNDEYTEIKNHTQIGSEFFENSEIFSNIAPVVKYHHERYDGKGYPENLTGENIPLFARITAVADSFDAMASNRVYRNNLDIDFIKNEIRNNRGTQFDSNVADAFLDIIENNYDEIEKIQKKYEI